MGRRRKKKSRSARKKKDQRRANAPPEKLIRQAAQELENGRARDAITLLKLASRKKRGDDEIRGLFLRAYLLREEQLRRKGLEVEAESVHLQALSHLPQTGPLAEVDLGALVRAGGMDDAVKIYNRHLSGGKPLVSVERQLAERLLISGQWILLEKVDSAAGLHREAEHAQAAAELMNAGRWDAALQRLAPVSRSSPYATLRLLCHAMVIFLEGRDESLDRVVAIMPRDSLLYSLIKTLAHAPQTLNCLWERPVYPEDKVRKIIADMRQHRFRNLESILPGAARSLYPRDPEVAMGNILEAFWSLGITNDSFRDGYFDLIDTLLPGEAASLLQAKMDFYYFDQLYIDAGIYLEELGAEFPDPRDEKIAAATILFQAVERLRRNDDFYRMASSLSRHLEELLGISSDDPDVRLLEMLSRAIELDPSARHVYGLMAQMPRYSRAAKNLVEAGLKTMMRQFDDDPFPCLELATLYYEKNAYRKAEAVLSEAIERAPHDAAVLERHVYALLISAGKRIRRKKFHLASEDLEKARRLCSGESLALVVAKQVVFDVEQRGQLDLFGKAVDSRGKKISPLVEQALEPLCLLDRLKMLGLLINDAMQRQPRWADKQIKELRRMLSRECKQLERLSSRDIRGLLQPLKKELTSVVRERRLAGIYLRARADILRLLRDDDYLSVLDALVQAGLFGEVIKENRRRLKKGAGASANLLDFYVVVIRHLADDSLHDADAFETVVQRASDPSEREALRAAARRLARNACGDLEKALLNFDFNLLRPRDFFPPDFFPVIADDDAYDEFDDEIDGLNDIAEMQGLMDLFMGKSPSGPLVDRLLEMVEKMVDSFDLREASTRRIRRAREGLMRRDPEIAIIGMMVRQLNEKQMARLSREALQLLFG